MALVDSSFRYVQQILHNVILLGSLLVAGSDVIYRRSTSESICSSRHQGAQNDFTASWFLYPIPQLIK